MGTFGSPYQLLKSNETVQRAIFDLADTEQAMIAFIVDKMNLIDNQVNYEFSISEIYDELGIDDTEGSYRSVKSTLKRLRDKSLFILTENNIETIISWINKVCIDKEAMIVNIEVDKNMIPYVTSLKVKFTKDKLKSILKMKSQYSIFFYDVIKDIETSRSILFEMDTLKSLLMVDKIPSYESFKEFRKYVLDRIIKEINECTDLIIDYEAINDGGKITKINFLIIKQIDKNKNGIRLL
jgi:plasmid replication initiation protein